MNPLLQEHDITPDDTLVYLHVPKTGGTTLMTHLDPMWHPAARFDGWPRIKIHQIPPDQVSRYKSFIGHYYYSQLEAIGVTPFVGVTSLRDPLKRALSHYAYLRSPGYEVNFPKLKDEIARVRQLSLDEYIDSGLLYDDSCNLQTRMLGNWRPGSPRRSKDESVNANLLAAAKQHLEAMDCFALSERMQDSLFLFSYVFGWRPLVNELHLNTAKKRTDAAPLSAYVQEHLTADNALDEELYKFATRLFDARVEYMTTHLLERYGGAQEAHLSYPLSVKVLAELLERHYRARYRGRHKGTPLHAPLSHISLGDNLEGAENWFMREGHATYGAFRWTGPNTNSFIDLPNLAGGDLTLSLYVIMGSTQKNLDTLRLTVNGQDVAYQSTDVPPGKIVTASLTRAQVGDEPLVRVGIHVAETLVPPANGAAVPDTRELGVAVESIELCVTSNAEPANHSLHQERARYAALERDHQNLQEWARSLEQTALEQQARLNRYERWVAPLAKISPRRWLARVRR